MGGWFGFENEAGGAAISGSPKDHRWEDYIDGMDEQSIKCAERIRSLVLAKWPEGIPLGGFWHQGQTGDEKTVPVAACGGMATFSMRAWGDIIAAIMSSRDDKNYSYTDFAWYSAAERNMKLIVTIEITRNKEGRFKYKWDAFDEDNLLDKSGGMFCDSYDDAAREAGQHINNIITFVNKITGKE